MKMNEPKKRGRPRLTPEQRANKDIKDLVVEKKKRNRPDLANFGQEFIEPGDNTKFITFALESMRLPKLNYDDLDAVGKRIEWYFERCATQDMKPGVVGLANALGVDRITLWSWKAGTRRADNPKFTELIRQAYGFLEEMWEMYMQNGKISPPNGIFLGKNNFNYKDVQDVVVTPNNPYETEQPNAVRDKYIEGLDIPTDGKVE